MAVDIEDGNSSTVPITGTTCFYVLTVVVGKDLEMSVYTHEPADLDELRVALEEALNAKQALILLRADMPLGAGTTWQALDPGVFAKRIPRP
ncbi:MAG: hypothetical protein WAN74_07365 [Thermoplasmata archaeon]